MIEIKNLKKVYPSNKLVSINDTTLCLPNTGLITLFGQSGSGKTTLLNVIGGLDRFNSGSIEFDNVKFNKYDMKKIDKYRNNNVSYIFQNYYLVEDLTVYQNLKLALEINDIYDENEQEKRIKESLNAVGLYKFRKKKVDSLSGGQQQRVAIARALTKRNKLIIADEPTGNLDSKNSIQVMNILKKISKYSLVLLVTHNKSLAEYYSDVIYRIKDGKVIDSYEPTNAKLDVSDNTLYLKDMDKVEVNDGSNIVKIYNNSLNGIKLDVIFVNDTFYIQSNQNIKLLKDSNLKAVDKHKKDVSKEEILQTEFDNSNFEDIYNHKKLRKINLRIKEAIKNFTHTKKKVKFMRFGLFLIGMGFAYLFGNLLNNFQIDSSSILQSRNTYIADFDYNYSDSYTNEVTQSELINLYDAGQISYFNLQGSAIGSTFYSTSVDCNVEFYLYKKDIMPNDKVLYGTYDDNSTGVVISKGLAKEIISYSNDKLKLNQLIGKSLNISRVTNANTSYYFFGVNDAYTIDAIIDNDSKSAYVPSYDNGATTKTNIALGVSIETNYFRIGSMTTNCRYYNSRSELEEVLEAHGDPSNPIGDSSVEYSYVIDSGNEPSDKYDVMVSSNYAATKDGMLLLSILKTLNFNICGYFTNTNDVAEIMFCEESRNRFFDLAALYIGQAEFAVYDDIIPNTYDNVINYYETNKKILNHDTIESNKVNIIIMACLLLVLVLYIYFTERSRMFVDIKKIGILRAIGESKSDIALTYAANSLVETLLTTTIGFIFATIVYGWFYSVSNDINHVITTAFYQLPLYYAGLFILIVIFVFLGALPSIFLMKKTPSEIIAKYDI